MDAFVVCRQVSNLAIKLAGVLAAVTAATAWLVTGAGAASRAQLAVGGGCYLVGHKVRVAGRGFLPRAIYDLAVDGVDFGQSRIDSHGAFHASLRPGGLAAGQAQLVHRLTASDGVRDVSAPFTVTRATGALVGAGRGTSIGRTVPFEAWDFGRRHRIYVHYVLGRSVRTIVLGRAGGQCGYLRRRRPLFPFHPRAGEWTLQFDTAHAYSHTAKRVARVAVTVG